MQYAQRKLQRSVTDSRRLRNGRPRVSTASCMSGFLVLDSHLQIVDRPRPERSRRNLALEVVAPPAWYVCTTAGAAAARRDPVVADVVPVALDQRVSAAWAVGVFEVADLPRQVAGVHVLKAGAAADGGGGEQHLGRRVDRFPHLVVSVKRRHVPWDVR